MSTTRMRLGALVSAGVLGLGLSACGADDATEGGDDTSAAATDEAQEAGNEATEESDAAGETEDAAASTEDAAAATEDETEAAGDAEGEDFPIDDFLAMVQEPGEETLSSYTMTMTLEGGGAGETMDASGAVDLTGGEAAMNLTMTLPEMGDVEMITIDGEVFMAMPGITPDGMYVQSEEDLLQGAGGVEELDVTSQWDAWEEGAEEVRFLGNEDVDGTELGRYRITVDAAAAAESMGEDAAALGVDMVVYDVWLDSDNLMRMVSFDIEGVVAEMTMDNWGEPQTIEAPAADQVMDMDELMNSGNG